MKEAEYISVTYKNTVSKETYQLGMFLTKKEYPNEVAWESGFRTALERTGWDGGDMIVSKIEY